MVTIRRGWRLVSFFTAATFFVSIPWSSGAKEFLHATSSPLSRSICRQLEVYRKTQNLQPPLTSPFVTREKLDKNNPKNGPPEICKYWYKNSKTGKFQPFILDGVGQCGGPDDPGEYGDHFQGDIMFPANRAGNIGYKTQRWPNNTIPYTFSDILWPSKMVEVEEATKEITKVTDGCIKFVKRVKEESYVDIVNWDPGCFVTNVGHSGGRQEMNLAQSCQRGSIMHEFIHVIGFFHEQSRQDRDDYVTIIEENIMPRVLFAFRKHDLTESFGSPYDFESIMHYRSTAFGKNSTLVTIVTKPPGKPIGQRNGLSTSDIQQIRRMYGCEL